MYFFCFLSDWFINGTWDLSSLTEDWTHILCIGRWILNHWTTREGPSIFPVGTFMIIPRGQTKQNFRLTFKLSKRETWLERIMLVKVQPMSFWETSGKPKWGSFYQKINWPRLFKSQRRHREALRESPWYSLPPAVFTQLCVPIHLHGHLEQCPHPFPLLACWVDGDVYFLPPSASMLGSSSLSECQWGLCLFWLSPGVPLGDMLEHAWLQV